MQLGMIGLGRMGANIVRRLMRDGHTCVVYDVSPDAVSALVGGGGHGGELARRLRRQARRPAPCLDDGARRRDHRDGGRELAAHLELGRRRRRRRQLVLPRRHPPGSRARRARHRLPRLRHERRRLWSRAWLLPHGRRPRRGVCGARADLCHARARGRRGGAHTGPRAARAAPEERATSIAARPERGTS